MPPSVTAATKASIRASSDANTSSSENTLLPSPHVCLMPGLRPLHGDLDFSIILIEVRGNKRLPYLQLLEALVKLQQ